MILRAYDAIVLDIDGTLATDDGTVPPRNLDALQSAHADGVRVMLATGRSEGATVPILDRLGFETPAILYNGAGLYCPVKKCLLEERLLGNRTVERTLEFARRQDLLVAVMRYGAKYARLPRNEIEEDALAFLEDMHYVADGALPTENVMRITVYSDRHDTTGALADDLERAVDLPMYVTHFPLDMLPGHRESPLLVADVQPPCRGKAEALRVLEERYGIPPARVVAVGDAGNDVPMLTEAGLGIVVSNGHPDALEVADRVIGPNTGPAIVDLLAELFPTA